MLNEFQLQAITTIKERAFDRRPLKSIRPQFQAAITAIMFPGNRIKCTMSGNYYAGAVKQVLIHVGVSVDQIELIGDDIRITI